MTTGIRMLSCRAYLGDLSSFINSLNLWLSNDEASIDGCVSDFQQNKHVYDAFLADTSKALAVTGKECHDRIRRYLDQLVLKRYDEAIHSEFVGTIYKLANNDNTSCNRAGEQYCSILGYVYCRTPIDTADQ